MADSNNNGNNNLAAVKSGLANLAKLKYTDAETREVARFFASIIARQVSRLPKIETGKPTPQVRLERARTWLDAMNTVTDPSVRRLFHATAQCFAPPRKGLAKHSSVDLDYMVEVD